RDAVRPIAAVPDDHAGRDRAVVGRVEDPMDVSERATLARADHAVARAARTRPVDAAGHGVRLHAFEPATDPLLHGDAASHRDLRSTGASRMTSASAGTSDWASQRSAIWSSSPTSSTSTTS